MNTSQIKRYFICLLIFAFVVSMGSHHALYSQTTSGEKTKDKTSSAKTVVDKSTQTSAKDSNFTWYKYDDGLAKAKKEKKHVKYIYRPVLNGSTSGRVKPLKGARPLHATHPSI